MIKRGKKKQNTTSKNEFYRIQSTTSKNLSFFSDMSFIEYKTLLVKMGIEKPTLLQSEPVQLLQYHKISIFYNYLMPLGWWRCFLLLILTSATLLYIECLKYKKCILICSDLKIVPISSY